MVEPDFISVKMDKPVKGAEPWDNEVHWQWDTLNDFATDVKFLGERS